MRDGKLFSIEGSDGSGKNTQARLLTDALNKDGYASEMISFPRFDTPTGRIIGQAYLGKKDLAEKFGWRGDDSWFGDATELDPYVSSLLYAADRRAALPEMRRKLAAGTNLVLDRWVESNMAHQGAKCRNGADFEAFVAYVEDLEYRLHALPKPTVTAFLHVSPLVSVELRARQKRVDDGHEVSLSYLHASENAYLDLAKRYGWKNISCSPDGTFASLRSQEDIAQEIYGIIRPILEK